MAVIKNDNIHISSEALLGKPLICIVKILFAQRQKAHLFSTLQKAHLEYSKQIEKIDRGPLILFLPRTD